MHKEKSSSVQAINYEVYYSKNKATCVEWVCGECGRSFASERSLQQHHSMTSCGLKHPSATECWKCIAKGMSTKVYKSHNASNCKIIKGDRVCSLCISNGELPHVYRSHIDSECKGRKKSNIKKRSTDQSDLIARLGEHPSKKAKTTEPNLGKRPLAAF